MKKVSLREITKENVNQVLALKVRDDQQHLVAPNGKSIAQGHYSDYAWFRAIYADEEPVGFVMLHLEPDEGEYWVWRYMVGAEHQGKGYGKIAMEQVIDFVRSQPNARELKLSFVPAENNPRPFYSRCGFVETGEMMGEERVMKLTLE